MFWELAYRRQHFQTGLLSLIDGMGAGLEERIAKIAFLPDFVNVTFCEFYVPDEAQVCLPFSILGTFPFWNVQYIVVLTSAFSCRPPHIQNEVEVVNDPPLIAEPKPKRSFDDDGLEKYLYEVKVG